MSDHRDVYLPRPRRMRSRSGSFVLPAEGCIRCRGEVTALAPIARLLAESVRDSHGLNWEVQAVERDQGPAAVTLELVRRGDLPSQGYRMSIDGKGIILTASDAAGIFYGVMTLQQMLRQHRQTLPATDIEDFPDFPSRGVMLDISRDKVPTMDTLFRLVDDLAALKINHLELYMEHTFAYRNHREVWAQASPLTGEEILRLDAYCRDRFIELVPNQNSFGHFHRWLELPRYIGMAECPDGFDHAWGKFNHPFGLNPVDKRSLDLLAELFAELLPYFTSRKFNVGCDETIDLGLGRSKTLCERKGKGRVYLDFLLKIHRLVKRHGRTMHFWGDIILQHPELVPELPKDIVVLEWGYEADHPFEKNSEQFAKSGLPFYVCPGTSTWQSFAGRTDNCLGNLRSAARNGIKFGATGFLNTDWGDLGHLQYLPASYLGFSAGAALSWCYDANRDTNFVSELDTHVFRDAARVMGRLAHDLGNAYLRAGHQPRNASQLGHILVRPDHELPAEVTARTLTGCRAYIDKVMSTLGQARMNRPDQSTLRAEYANTARMMTHACDRGIAIRRGKLNTAATKAALARDLRIILGEHRELWLARNRIGGLHDSARRLEKLLDEYAK